MIRQLLAYQEKNLEEIIEATKEFEEKFKQSGDVFTAVLIYGEGPLSYTSILKMTRRSDRLFKLEENLFLLIFPDTDIEGGIVASEKLLPELSKRPGVNVYVAAIESKKGREGALMVHTLFNILEFAINHHHENEVLDSSYLDSVY